MLADLKKRKGEEEGGMPAGRVARPASRPNKAEAKPAAALTGDLVQRGRDRSAGAAAEQPEASAKPSRTEASAPVRAAPAPQDSPPDIPEAALEPPADAPDELDATPDLPDGEPDLPDGDEERVRTEAETEAQESVLTAGRARGTNAPPAGIRAGDITLFALCFAIFFPVILIALSFL